MRTLVTLLTMFFCFALGVFMFQNTQPTDILYFRSAARAPLWLVVVASVMAGLLFAIVVQAIERLDMGRERRRLEKEIEELRGELDRLRRGGGDS